jgi:hypothetical protein
MAKGGGKKKIPASLTTEGRGKHVYFCGLLILLLLHLFFFGEERSREIGRREEIGKIDSVVVVDATGTSLQRQRQRWRTSGGTHAALPLP